MGSFGVLLQFQVVASGLLPHGGQQLGVSAATQALNRRFLRLCQSSMEPCGACGRVGPLPDCEQNIQSNYRENSNDNDTAIEQ